jgi:hypothetical protein
MITSNKGKIFFHIGFSLFVAGDYSGETREILFFFYCYDFPNHN